MPSVSEQQSPFETSGARQMAAWILRLPQSPRFRWMLAGDPHLFGLLYASCAAAVHPPESLIPARITGEDEPDRLLPTLKDLQRQFGERTSGRFARLYLQGAAACELMLREESRFERALAEWREAADVAAARYITGLDRNIDRLARLLGLAPLERDLLAFQLGRRRPGFSHLCELLVAPEDSTAAVLGAALAVSPAEVRAAVAEDAELVRSGILTVEERPLRISGPSTHLHATLADDADDDSQFTSRFLAPLAPKPSIGSLGRLHEDDARILLDLLRAPLPDGGAHVLVHGPKSVDKLELLARLLGDGGLRAHAVNARRVPAGDLASWAYLAQRRLERDDAHAVLVIDRAHDALACRPARLLSLFGVDDDAPAEDPERASDLGLTAAPARCVWVTDRAAQLSERNLGAFLFHCEAMPGTRAERRERVARAISDLGLSEQLGRELANYSLLSDRQVRRAAELARLVAAAGCQLEQEPAEARERLIRRAVAHSQKVLGRERTEGLRDSVTEYRLELLNTAGRFTPAQILAALRRRPKGSLCFWGIPGAGKTQLAEHIAIELDLPILMRSASDLLSKWVGETEQQLAAMFAEAHAEGALLFLDEADSFLRDRSLARAEWSVTQVNELLARMERFDGIFIAATNLMDSIDAAAMRRFTWKVEFLPLTADQAWSMFSTEAAVDADVDAERSRELRRRLDEIGDLAPGDFATVKRQALMLGEQLDPDAWIDQLAAEAKAKMLGLRRRALGFS